jgi:hypothetical protein
LKFALDFQGQNKGAAGMQLCCYRPTPGKNIFSCFPVQVEKQAGFSLRP